jgi:septum formation protein
VILDHEILGKPTGESNAREILAKLSGRTHQVITGVCIQKGQQKKSFSTVTEVSFRELTAEQTEHYVSIYKPYDKAGAYAIQEWIGMIGIKGINGDYYNVMGLPIGEVVLALKEFTD